MAWLKLRLPWRKKPSSSAKISTAKIGQWGEKLATTFLRKSGYKIIGRRVRPNRRDEIDIIALKGRFLVFVEVKTRKSEHYGRPAAAVDHHKQRSLCRAAAAYLRRASYPSYYYRFDVIEVVGSYGDVAPTIRHLENVFQFPTSYRFNLKFFLIFS